MRTICSTGSGRPVASNAKCTPAPPVRSRTASTGSVPDASTASVAPKCRAHASFCAAMSTAMIRAAPATFAPATTDNPTPPQPTTATVAPGHTGVVLVAAPKPVETPQASRHAFSSGTWGGILTACAACTIVRSVNVPARRTGASVAPSDAR